MCISSVISCCWNQVDIEFGRAVPALFDCARSDCSIHTDENTLYICQLWI
uniref:Uncharacterized protein n=1 Tax=Anopheles dirus TaxID=7168 RepID=A0A182NWC5_9DIPT